MKNYLNLLQGTVVVLIISLNGYAIADGIRLGSFLGIVFALGSLTALIYCIRLVNKLKKLDEEEWDN